MADLTIHELQNEATTPAADDYMVMDGATAGTRKITPANLATWIHNKWASFVSACTSITSFASGDTFSVSNPTDGTRKMSKDTLLELTAQNALAGNVAPEFDSTTTYSVGDFFCKEGCFYQVISPIAPGAFDSSKVLDVQLSDIAKVSVGAGIIMPHDFAFVGEGTTLLSTPLFKIKHDNAFTIDVEADWNSSASSDQNKFCVEYFKADGTVHTVLATQVLGNNPVWSTKTLNVVNTDYLYFRIIARVDAGETARFSFKYDFSEFVYKNVELTYPQQKTITFVSGGNEDLVAIPFYGIDGGKFVRVVFANDWNDTGVTYNKFYLREFKSDGTYTDYFTIAAGGSVPTNIKFKTSYDCVYFAIYVRGASGQQVSANVSVSEILEKQKVSPLFIQHGNVEIGANVEPAYTNANFTSRASVIGYHNIPVNAGDTICCNSGYRFYIGFTATGTAPYTTSGWITSPSKYFIKTDGYVCILFATVGDVAFNDVKKFAENFFIMTDGNTGISPEDALTLSVKNGRSSVIGVNHRGYNNIAPENTLPAFKMSYEFGFKWVETDLRYSSDGVPVLLHDATVDRTSNGSGNVNELTIDQLKALDFGSWKNARYTGTRIPTFDEFLKLIVETGLNVVLEIKAGTFATFYDSVFKKIQKANIADKFIFLTDSETWLTSANASLAGSKLMYLVGSGITVAEEFFDGLTNLNRNKYLIATSKTDILDTEAGAACKYPFFTWTVDLPKVVITQVGIRGVISNVQDASRNILEYFSAPVQNAIR